MLKYSSDIFQSFFMGGFECSTHINKNNVRLDMIAATEHDKYCMEDYKRLADLGIKTARDGIRWHIIEQVPGRYNFKNVVPMIHAASHTRTQIIWDLCHYGWPEYINIFKPEFIASFVSFTREFLKVLTNETDAIPFITPVNEISYFSWACGEVGYMYPYCYGKGYQLKQQLIRATIEATEAIWDMAPQARVVNVDPAIYVTPNGRQEDLMRAHQYNELQYQSRDMLIGKICPELGGAIKYLDIIGVNFYPFSQWTDGSSVCGLDNDITKPYQKYRGLDEQMEEIYHRYKRPIFISETGTEADARGEWFDYVIERVELAQARKVPVQGICWYPIVNNPHWDTDRICNNGFWSYANHLGERTVYTPLANRLLKCSTVN